MQSMDLREFLSLRIKLSNVIYFLSAALLWYVVFINFNLYRSRRLDHKIQQWKDIIKATTIATIIFFVGGRIFDIVTFTPNFCITFWLSTTIFTILFRGSLRYFLEIIRRKGRTLRFVLIIGTNQRAYDIETWINRHKEMGYRVKGFLDDIVYTPRNQVPILGKLSDFSDIIRSTIIDEVFVALPIKSHYEVMQKIIEQAEEQGIIVRYLSHLFNTKMTDPKSRSLEDFPTLETVNGSHENWNLVLKRVLDIFLALFLLIAAFPVLLAAAIAIKLTSKGPILFIQNRVGYNKRVFPVYKFRTMDVDAEKLQKDLEDLNEMEGPVFKIQNDPRITRVGKWLRRTSLDEFPQFVNVLKGDMSLVGPRPLPVRDYEGFDMDWQRRRFSVRPGITCLWQVCGRNSIPFEKWMELDMQYIDQWSLWLDIKILTKTISAVFKGSGAV